MSKFWSSIENHEREASFEGRLCNYIIAKPSLQLHSIIIIFEGTLSVFLLHQSDIQNLWKDIFHNYTSLKRCLFKLHAYFCDTHYFVIRNSSEARRRWLKLFQAIYAIKKKWKCPPDGLSSKWENCYTCYALTQALPEVVTLWDC